MGIEIVHQTDLCARVMGIKFQNKQLFTPMFFPAISSIETKFKVDDLVYLITNSAYPQMLISAYDYNYHLNKNKKLRNVINEYSRKGNFLFVDSGGYESFWEKKRKWNFGIYKKTISKINSDFYTSLDGIKKSSYTAEFEKFFRKIISLGSILSKSQYIPIFHADSNVKLITLIKKFLEAYPAALRCIAIRERECGVTISERAKTIFKIRTLLNAQGNSQILHILGAGNPLSITLYSYFGADSFDSTDWVRFTLDPKRLILRDLTQLEIMECKCKACTKISDPLFRTLLHNLNTYNMIMSRIQKHIQNNSLREFLIQNGLSNSFLNKITGT